MWMRLTRLGAFSILLFVSIGAHGMQSDEAYFNQLNSKLLKDILLNSTKSIAEFQEGIERYKSSGDTLKTIALLSKVANVYAQIADYGNSYDRYWEALILADRLGSEGAKADVYNGLGWLYSFYRRKKTAIRYYNLSIAINRKIEGQSPTNQQKILDNYYALATLYRKNSQTDTAKIYLDSCRSMMHGYLDNNTNRSYVLAEEGYVSFEAQQTGEALDLLNKSRVFFEKYDSSYLIIMYPFFGDIYLANGQEKTAEAYYIKAIKISGIYQSHLDLIPDIYAKLSELYFRQGKYRLSHDFMKRSIQLNEAQFGSRSAANRGLLEIKDNFRIELERKNKLMQQQQLATMAQTNKNRQLQLIILMLSFVFTLISSILIYRNLTAKYRTEKMLLIQQKEMETIKNKEIIEAKNKELTTSALHLIEKEELLAETKNDLEKQKTNPNSASISRIIKKLNLSTNQSWKEFELRFLHVNKEFYIRLKRNHPSLSQNDHKICALIKLNFSSKDMANLLGISVESVHTTRYRLRKKMGLDRKDNLEDYIANI